MLSSSPVKASPTQEATKNKSVNSRPPFFHLRALSTLFALSGHPLSRPRPDMQMIIMGTEMPTEIVKRTLSRFYEARSMEIKKERIEPRERSKF